MHYVPSLVYENEISDARSTTRLDEFGQDIRASVDALSIGQQDLQLLDELRQLGAWIARGSEHNLGLVGAELGVLVVEQIGLRGVFLCAVSALLLTHCALCTYIILELNFFHEIFCFFSQLRGDGLALCNNIV